MEESGGFGNRPFLVAVAAALIWASLERPEGRQPLRPQPQFDSRSCFGTFPDIPLELRYRCKYEEKILPYEW